MTVQELYLNWDDLKVLLSCKAGQITSISKISKSVYVVWLDNGDYISCDQDDIVLNLELVEH